MNREARRLWTERKLAEFENKSIHSVRRDRRLGLGPPYERVGGAIRYQPEVVEAYLQWNTSTGPKARRRRARSVALSAD